MENQEYQEYNLYEIASPVGTEESEASLYDLKNASAAKSDFGQERNGKEEKRYCGGRLSKRGALLTGCCGVVLVLMVILIPVIYCVVVPKLIQSTFDSGAKSLSLSTATSPGKNTHVDMPVQALFFLPGRVTLVGPTTISMASVTDPSNSFASMVFDDVSFPINQAGNVSFDAVLTMTNLSAVANPIDNTINDAILTTKWTIKLFGIQFYKDMPLKTQMSLANVIPGPQKIQDVFNEGTKQLSITAGNGTNNVRIEMPVGAVFFIPGTATLVGPTTISMASVKSPDTVFATVTFGDISFAVNQAGRLAFDAAFTITNQAAMAGITNLEDNTVNDAILLTKWTINLNGTTLYRQIPLKSRMSLANVIPGPQKIQQVFENGVKQLVLKAAQNSGGGNNVNLEMPIPVLCFLDARASLSPTAIQLASVKDETNPFGRIGLPQLSFAINKATTLAFDAKFEVTNEAGTRTLPTDGKGGMNMVKLTTSWTIQLFDNITLFKDLQLSAQYSLQSIVPSLDKIQQVFQDGVNNVQITQNSGNSQNNINMVFPVPSLLIISANAVLTGPSVLTLSSTGAASNSFGTITIPELNFDINKNNRLPFDANYQITNVLAMTSLLKELGTGLRASITTRWTLKVWGTVFYSDLPLRATMDLTSPAGKEMIALSTKLIGGQVIGGITNTISNGLSTLTGGLLGRG